MYRKRFVLLTLMLLIFTGCTKITNDLDSVVNAVMIPNEVKVNTVSYGYEIYIPNGVSQIIDNDYNQQLKIKDRYVYLYVDTISYYYKNMLNYKSDKDYSYYYKKINLDNKTGYIGIDKISDDNYFCEIVYNYTKTEFYSNERDLPIIVANALIIQKSIIFNDRLIKLSMEDNTSDSKEIKYELDKPKDATSTFSQYLQEYVADEEPVEELPDED